MDQSYVASHTIFETIVGSRAYGIHNEDSDYDKAGVMIPDKSFFYGWKKFEQFQGFEDDHTVYDIRKAMKLIRDNNPNMMDLLWMPEKCIVLNTPHWGKVIENRNLFLSKRVRYTYSGYAIAQLNRIKTHRKFLLNPPKTEPSRISYGLPEVSIFPTAQLKAIVYSAMEFVSDEDKPNFINELDALYGDYLVPLLSKYLLGSEKNTALEWLQMGIKSQAKAFISLGTQYLKEEFLEQAKKEVLYYNACLEWSQYKNWKQHRNKKRAILEEKHGYDCKHAAHLVRLLRTGIEALEQRTVNVDRTNIDADELKAIRNGAWPFEIVEEYSKDMDTKLEKAYQISILQKTPAEEKIHNLCVSIVEDYNR